MFSETILLASADPMAKYLAPAEGTELSELGSIMREYLTGYEWAMETPVRNLHYGPTPTAPEIVLRNLLYAQGAELTGLGVLREDGRVKALAYTGSFGSLWLVTSEPKTPQGAYWVGVGSFSEKLNKKKTLRLVVYPQVVPEPCLEPMARMLEARLRPILPMSGARNVGVMNGPLEAACRGSTLEELLGTGDQEIPRLLVPFMGVATFHLPCYSPGRFKATIDPEWFNAFASVCQFAVEKASQLKALSRAQIIDMMGILARKIPAIAFLSEASISCYLRMILTETEAYLWKTGPDGKPLAKTTVGTLIRGRTKCAGCEEHMDAPRPCSCGCGKNYCLACNCIQACSVCGAVGLNRTVSACCHLFVCSKCEGSCCGECAFCHRNEPKRRMVACIVCNLHVHRACKIVIAGAHGGDTPVCLGCVIRCPSCGEHFAGQGALDIHLVTDVPCQQCKKVSCTPLRRCLICHTDLCRKCLPTHVLRCLNLPPRMERFPIWNFQGGQAPTTT